MESYPFVIIDGGEVFVNIAKKQEMNFKERNVKGTYCFQLIER